MSIYCIALRILSAQNFTRDKRAQRVISACAQTNRLACDRGKSRFEEQLL